MAADVKIEFTSAAVLSDGILKAVGKTPLVRLTRLFPSSEFHLHAKLEMANPGGSGKDRSALGMLLDGCERGEIGPGTTVIESSSGNLGVGLAQACAYLNLRFICVVDARTTANHVAILKAYGAEVEIVTPDDAPDGDLLAARLHRVQQLKQRIGDSYWINQYANPSNPQAQYEVFREIQESLPGGVDYLFVATSTCGTLRGCREFIRDHWLGTRLIAVDAAGSVIFGDTPKPRLIPGHGASRRPPLYEENLEDEHIHVTDGECIAGCFRLLRREAIFAGGSSGAVVAAIGKMGHRIPRGATVAAILCDRGDRYLDTIYSPHWIGENFGAGFEPWRVREQE